MAKSDGQDYFKRTSLFWIVTVSLSFGYFTCVVFAPEKIPFENLGPFGTFCTFLVENHSDLLYKMWIAASAVHVFEAIIALSVCSKKGIDGVTTRLLWFVQTLLFGIASLGMLLRYDPERPKQQ